MLAVVTRHLCRSCPRNIWDARFISGYRYHRV